MNLSLYRFLALVTLAGGCGTSAVNAANRMADAGDGGTGDGTTADGALGDSAGGDGGLGDSEASSPCGNLATNAKAILGDVVDANALCDADLDCTNLLWPSCLGCGAYSVNESGAPAVSLAIDRTCADFNDAGCVPPAGSCPTSYGLSCSSGRCLINPPLLGP